MPRRTAHILVSVALAAGGVPALAACGEDDRPEREDIERGVDDATDEAGEAAEDAGDALEDAGNDAEDATRDGE